uniref:Uncharacterized protein n=1 Tax=Lepeophtheirus salmonis TaxID=72036 RepID=A0A0K2UQU7_LEPSM
MHCVPISIIPRGLRYFGVNSLLDPAAFGKQISCLPFCLHI